MKLTAELSLERAGWKTSTFLGESKRRTSWMGCREERGNREKARKGGSDRYESRRSEVVIQRSKLEDREVLPPLELHQPPSLLSRRFHSLSS